MGNFYSLSQSGSSEREIKESKSGLTLSFVGTLDNQLKKKIHLITITFKCTRIYIMFKRPLPGSFIYQGTSIWNLSISDFGLRELRSRSCTRWLFLAPVLCLYMDFFLLKHLTEQSQLLFCAALKATCVCMEHQSSPGHGVCQRETMPRAQSYLLASEQPFHWQV